LPPADIVRLAVEGKHEWQTDIVGQPRDCIPRRVYDRASQNWIGLSIAESHDVTYHPPTVRFLGLL
jgi:hypothetical protein